jgi:uncharacterized MAPEG superfamily protein
MTIAFWCVFIAALLPYVAFSFVRGVDAKTPRASVAGLTGTAARAHAAHLNAFEAFAPFAAAVIISHLSLGANSWSNVLAVVFVLARAAHIGFYLGDIPPARTAAFTVGVACVVALFLHAGLG